MARGQRKTIEDKITEKQEVIQALNSRLEKETIELEALLDEQKKQEIGSLYDFIKGNDLDIHEAVNALTQYLSDKYKEMAS